MELEISNPQVASALVSHMWLKWCGRAPSTTDLGSDTLRWTKDFPQTLSRHRIGQFHQLAYNCWSRALSLGSLASSPCHAPISSLDWRECGPKGSRNLEKVGTTQMTFSCLFVC